MRGVAEALSKVLLLLVLALALPVQAQDLPPQVEAQIARIGEQQTLVREILKRYGFPPPAMAQEAWRNLDGMPARDLVENAWRSAEKAAAGSGDELLGRLHAEYAKLNPAMYLDSDVPKMKESPRLVFSYASLVEADLARPLPPSVDRYLNAVARHADGNLAHHLGRCCGVQSKRVAEILRTSKTPRAAMAAILKEGSLPPELRQRLALLLESVISSNPAIAFEGEFSQVREALLRSAKPNTGGVSSIAPENAEMARFGRKATAIDDALGKEIPSIMESAKVASPKDMTLGEHVVAPFQPPASPPDSSPSIGGGGGGGSRLATSSDRAFDATHHGPPAAARTAVPPGSPRSFSRVIVRGGGRGGVVFGNTVDGSKVGAKPLSVSWLPLDMRAPVDSNTLGTFRMRLSDDRVVFTPAVRAGIALAAVRVGLTGLANGTDRASPGAEIGLAGLHGFFTRPLVSEAGLTVDPDNGKGFYCTDFVVHPAIVDTPVGRAAIVVDGLLMGPHKPVLQAVLAGGGLSPADLQQFEAYQSAVRWITYKFIDRPLSLSVDGGGVIRASAAAQAGQAGEPPRLTLNRFKEKEGPQATEEMELVVDKPEQTLEAMRILRQASREVALLDAFAEQLAILRWAAANDAQWEGGVDKSASLSPQTAHCMRGSAFELVSSRYALAAEIVDQVGDEGAKMLRAVKAPEPYLRLNDETTARRHKLVNMAAIGSLFTADLGKQAATAKGVSDKAVEEAIDRYYEVYLDLLKRSAQGKVDIKPLLQAKETIQKAASASSVAEYRMYAEVTSRRGNLWAADPGRLSVQEMLKAMFERLSLRDQQAFLASDASSPGIGAAVVAWLKLQHNYADVCGTGVCTEGKLRQTPGTAARQ